MRACWRGLVGLAVLALAGCAEIAPPDHLRLCRAVLPALHAEGTVIRETRHGVPASPANAIRIDYLTEEPGRPRDTRYVVCTFAGGDAEAGRLDLAALETERGPVSDVRLQILRRWWLGDPAVMAEQVARQRGQATALQVPFALAFALQQLANALVPAGVYGLLAVAYALIYGLIGRINLAFGDIGVAGTYATLGIVTALAASTSLPIALGAGLAAGMLSAALVNLSFGRSVVAALHARREGGQAILIASVGIAVALSETLRISHSSAGRWAPPIASTPAPLARSADFLATITPNQLAIFAITMGVALGVLAIMRHSAFGRRWRAFADDPGAAQLFGVDPRRMIAISFGLSGALAGLAGAAHALHFGSVHFAMGTALALKALIAAIAGGIGSVGGALAGGIALGLAETLWSGYGPIAWRDIVVFTALVVLIVMRSGGTSTGEEKRTWL